MPDLDNSLIVKMNRVIQEAYPEGFDLATAILITKCCAVMLTNYGKIVQALELQQRLADALPDPAKPLH